MVELNCDISIVGNTIGLIVPRSHMEEVAAFTNLLARRKLTQACVKLSLPHKPRSTGKRSQNRHTHGHARQISEYTGLTPIEVFADAMKNGPEPDDGWPTYTDYMGNVRMNLHESQWPSHVSNAVIEGMHRIEALIQQNVDPLFKLKEYEDD